MGMMVEIDSDVLLDRIRAKQCAALAEWEDVTEAERGSNDSYIAEGYYRGMLDLGAVVGQYLLNIMEGLNPSAAA